MKVKAFVIDNHKHIIYTQKILAHNIEDSARSAGSYEVDEQTLSVMKKELDQIIRNGYVPSAHQSIELIVEYMYCWITSNDNVFTIKEYETYHCKYVHLYFLHLSLYKIELTNIFIIIISWTGPSIITKLAEASITAHTFNTVLVPAYRLVMAHAEEIRKDAENGGQSEDNPSSSQVQIHRRKCLSNNSLNALQGTFMVLGFLFEEGKNYVDDYQMILSKRINRVSDQNNKKRRTKDNDGHIEPEWEFKLGFKCLNPGIIFRDMSETTKSVILTSGTLSPLNTFASELETRFEGRLEANHVIDKSQVWVGAIPKGPNGITLKGVYNNWESFQYQDDIGESLCKIVETVPFGVLCFLPSYSSIDKLVTRWKLTGLYDRLARRKMIHCEPRGSDKHEFEATIGSFYKKIDNVKDSVDELGRDGALFFAVFRGKVSEGIDFTDNYCRAVVTVGIPFPAIKDIEVKFKKEYNDKRKCHVGNTDLLSGSDWYSAQAFRAINQALGRCIRHKNDWGAIILLEDRFQSSRNIQSLSKWVRNQLRVHPGFPQAIMELNHFVQKQLARTAASSVNLSTVPSPLKVTSDSPITTPPNATEIHRIAPLTSSYPDSIDSVDTVHYLQNLTNIKPEIKSEFFVHDIKQTSVPMPVLSTAPLTKPILPKPIFSEPLLPNAVPLLPEPVLLPEPELIPEPASVEPVEPVSVPEPASVPGPISLSNPMVLLNSMPLSVSAISSPKLPESEPTSKPNVLSQFNMKFEKTQIKQDLKSFEVVTPVEFKQPEPIPKRIERKDLFSTRREDTSYVSITCTVCGRSLLEGPRKYAQPTSIKDLTIITKNSNIHSNNIVEITEPGKWEANGDLMGGPIDIKQWPNESQVTLNNEDRICYRSLTCACPISKPLGIVIRQSFGPSSRYNGKVYLWLNQLRIEETIKTHQTNLSYQPDEFDMPSSQACSMNDMFYNL